MILEQNQLNEILDDLLKRKEKEWFEFKEAKANFSFEDLGKYFSAISNEANLKGIQFGWIIFGVNDKGNIVGTNYRNDCNSLDSLKKEIADHTSERLSFIEIYDMQRSEGRVIMFQIPAAISGIPTAWKGHYFARDNESLAPLNIHKIEFIRNQKFGDWSSQICEKATIEDLSQDAIKRAREMFKEKNPKLVAEIEQWDDITFLNKAKITIDGRITRTAILLLGKDESSHHISPANPQISWILEDESNIKIDYEHFSTPFILTVKEAANKIRNLKYRYMPDNSLFPIEIEKYEPYIIREALHNCIAHQDYTLRGRINVIEKSDKLIFLNEGSFIPESIEKIFNPGYVPPFYRNAFLANSMVNLNMIDTIASGIQRMYSIQRKRYFPMPDYDLSNHNRVAVTIHGKVLDENYTKVLFNNTYLNINTVICLDKVQKRLPVSKEEHKLLRDQKLIEGRYPNVFVASHVAKVTGDKVQYIKNKAFDDKFYKKLILEFIQKYGSAKKEDIVNLIFDKLSDALDDYQKTTKIRNLTYTLSKKDKSIINLGTNRNPNWVIRKKD